MIEISLYSHGNFISKQIIPPFTKGLYPDVVQIGVRVFKQAKTDDKVFEECFCYVIPDNEQTKTVYSRKECTYQYCPHRSYCEKNDKCFYED